MSAERSRRLGRILSILLPLLAFLVGIRGMGVGFELLGREALERFFQVSENPFVGLLIGILSTSIVQSSSVTTSMIVGLVAAPVAPLPVANAIPMVMGANIGTTVTNTIVSLGHVTRPREFERAIAAGTCDDFFNLLAVAVLLPLEMATGAFEQLSGWLVRRVPRGDGERLGNPVSALADAVLDPLRDASLSLVTTPRAGAAIFLFISMGVIFGALYALVRQLRVLAGGRLERAVTRTLDASPFVGLSIGAGMTALVQSSSLTLSMLVPLAGTGLVTLEQVFPLMLGANFGTTITAFLASTAVPLSTFQQAVQIALVHMLFNVAGIVLVYPSARLRRVPLSLSRWLATVAVGSKLRAATYVVLLFYGLPLGALLLWRGL
ncbi:MAG: Na/Pi symporter [Myxococcales bacterium]|nr:Na/Pi symporter [Myxococcales bacterium]